MRSFAAAFVALVIWAVPSPATADDPQDFQEWLQARIAEVAAGHDDREGEHHLAAAGKPADDAEPPDLLAMGLRQAIGRDETAISDFQFQLNSYLFRALASGRQLQDSWTYLHGRPWRRLTLGVEGEREEDIASTTFSATVLILDMRYHADRNTRDRLQRALVRRGIQDALMYARALDAVFAVLRGRNALPGGVTNRASLATAMSFGNFGRNTTLLNAADVREAVVREIERTVGAQSADLAEEVGLSFRPRFGLRAEVTRAGGATEEYLLEAQYDQDFPSDLGLVLNAGIVRPLLDDAGLRRSGFQASVELTREGLKCWFDCAAALEGTVRFISSRKPMLEARFELGVDILAGVALPIAAVVNREEGATDWRVEAGVSFDLLPFLLR